LSRTLLAIGTVVKAFGIRGDLIISPLTDDVRRFKALKRVFIGTSEATATETVVTHVAISPRSVRARRPGVRVRLAAVEERTTAETFVGCFLFVDERDAVRPPKGSYFVHHVIGLSVLDEEENLLGVVKDVLKLSPNDIYVVEMNGKEVLLPAVKEFIKSIDVKAGTMTVKLIEGMLE
jgi:16S rRNA processing protein RimM